MITAAGAGSGIDIESIITQLMEIESAPQVALQEERESLDVELSAYGSIRSAMNELGTISTTLGDGTTFGPFVATTSDEEVMTATATGTASAEAHNIEILSLATAHRMASGPVASRDAVVDAGTYSFTAGGESFSFDLDAGSTLTSLRDAINDSEDNTGVVASILNVADGTRLILSARDTGVENSIAVNPPGTSLLSGFTEMSAAADAQLIVDGFEVSSASNTVTDVIEGITLEAAAIGEVALSTARDTESLSETLGALVANYNSLAEGLDSLGQDTLQGDSLPRDIESRLRSLFSEPITLDDGTEASALELGLTFDRFGTLSIDESRMAEIQDADLERFVDAFAKSETGFAAKLSEVIDAFTEAEGILDSREDSIASTQGRLDDRIDLYDYRLGLVETRYRNQFTAMDTAVALLNATSSQLFDTLGS